MSIFVLRLISAVSMAMLIVTAQTHAAPATPRALQSVFQDSDKSKSALYETFSKGMEGDANARKAAYVAGKEFLQKYHDEKDPRTKEITDWIASYETDMLGVEVMNYVYKERKYADAFRIGSQVLQTDPENLKVLTALGYAGMPASAAGSNELIADAIGYAKKSIQLIENGKAPSDWKPFMSRDETLGWLNYALGVMVLRNMPDEAISRLTKAAQYEGAPKQDPRVYYYLAALYGQGFEKQRSEYKSNYEGKTETPESKAALAKVSTVVDLIIDAYARAIAYTNSNPQLKQAFQQQEAEWTNKLTELYKSRHDGSDVGLKEMISGIRSKPLPGQKVSMTP